MKVEKPIIFLNSGKKILDETLRLIMSAQYSIEANFYHIANDEIGNKFADALIERARHGVQVTLMYDGHGSLLTGGEYFKKLQNNGVILYEHNPYTHWFKTLTTFIQVNHHKLLVIDHHTVLIGGANISDDFYTELAHDKWLDYGLVIHNPDLNTFIKEMYVSFRKKITLPLQYIHKDISFFHKSPGEIDAINKEVITRINAATNKIVIMHAYFVPEVSIVTALQDALARGVQVQIIIPHRYEFFLFRWVILLKLAVLFHNDAHSNLSVYIWPGKLHSKLLVVDEKSIMVGSYNFDYRSAVCNYECNVAVYDPILAKEVADETAKIMLQSRKIILLKQSTHSWFSKIRSVVLTILSRFM